MGQIRIVFMLLTVLTLLMHRVMPLLKSWSPRCLTTSVWKGLLLLAPLLGTRRLANRVSPNFLTELTGRTGLEHWPLTLLVALVRRWQVSFLATAETIIKPTSLALPTAENCVLTGIL